MYIPYVLHSSLHMLCTVTHCFGPLLYQGTTRWCKRMGNDCLINIFLFFLMMSLLTAHSFSGMGPKTISPPPSPVSCSFPLSLLQCVEPLVVVFCLLETEAFSSNSKNTQAFQVSQITLTIEEISPGVCQLSRCGMPLRRWTEDVDSCLPLLLLLHQTHFALRASGWS